MNNNPNHENFKIFCKTFHRDHFDEGVVSIEGVINEWLDENDGNLTITKYELDVHEIREFGGHAQQFCFTVTFFYIKPGQ